MEQGQRKVISLPFISKKICEWLTIRDVLNTNKLYLNGKISVEGEQQFVL